MDGPERDDAELEGTEVIPGDGGGRSILGSALRRLKGCDHSASVLVGSLREQRAGCSFLRSMHQTGVSDGPPVALLLRSQAWRTGELLNGLVARVVIAPRAQAHQSR